MRELRVRDLLRSTLQRAKSNKQDYLGDKSKKKGDAKYSLFGLAAGNRWINK